MNFKQEKTSLERLINLIPGRRNGIDCIGPAGSSMAYLALRLYVELRTDIFIVLPSPKEAERCIDDLHFFSKPNLLPIQYLPPVNLLSFKYLSYHNEKTAKRIQTLYRLINGEMPSICVTTIDALSQKIIPKDEICNYAELIMADEEIDRDLLIEKLISGGYVRTMMVEEPGDFSIRGGILDVFSPMYQDPVRIELFGDTVDAIRFFSAVDQRKMQDVREVVILPAREVILKKENMARIINRVREQASHLDLSVLKVREIVDRIKREGVFPGIESMIPMIYPELDTVFDYTPDNALYILAEPGELEKAAETLWDQASKDFLIAGDEARFCVEPNSLYLSWREVKDILEEKQPISIRTIPVSKGGSGSETSSSQIVFSIRDNSAMAEELKRYQDKDKPLLPLVDWISDKKRSGYTTLLVCSTRSQTDRLKSLLMPYGIQSEYVEDFNDIKHGKGRVFICLGQISTGCLWPAESLAIITEDEIFGAKYRRRRLSSPKIQTGLLAFGDLKTGDLIVHIEHGIGEYEGLVKLKLNGSTNDFLLISYRADDKLYLPVDRMNMVQKYIGVDGITPVLDRMGGASWDRVKKKVKKSAEKIAGELLALYAARKVEEGYAFQPPDSYFRDFEAGFAYEETPDQLKAIDSVLQDMEHLMPMDRLICGDVGYGKTEVALRASFLAVNDSKQVAVLVPTTVLAEQHFATFSSRFERYPVNIACLSRFRSKAVQRKIVDDLKAGRIDIVVGTHRLLQKDISFKNLGLVVLDEEQRFGVKDKEKLKKLRRTVDVLALTATPIPRTLHMSLMGVRDISVISTPPEHRQAIITYISEFDDSIITEAIRKELERKGQIFFVHNNIHSIWTYAKRLQELVPEVRLDVAHGRLKAEELERVMFKFVNRDIDMLVCTTIIGSGLDIPAANTILVNRADRFGLAQMYQLRGRVGRASEQAYAYLFIPKESKLGRDAQKRLKVLMEYSDLGSGFQIAMSDLKIRGGGTILGDAQSGHIAAVGYDMFLKLMESSMAELKGEPVLEDLEPEINVSMSAYIPETYVSDIDQRLMVYRRLTKMSSLEEISDFKEELIDRFGALPNEATNLLLKIMLKILSTKAGVKRLDLTGQHLSLSFSEAHQRNPFGIVDMITAEKGPYSLTPNHVFKAQLSHDSNDSLLAQSRNILKEIALRVNS